MTSVEAVTVEVAHAATLRLIRSAGLGKSVADNGLPSSIAMRSNASRRQRGMELNTRIELTVETGQSAKRATLLSPPSI